MMSESNEKTKADSVSPHRVVILGQDTGASKHRSLVDDIRQWLVPVQGRTPVSAEKIGLIVRIMETLTSYYRRPEYLERWAKTAIAMEELRGPEVTRHVVLLQGFQRMGQIETDNPDIDWWVFLAPDGLPDWEHPTDWEPETVHMFLHWVRSEPEAMCTCLNSMDLAGLIFLLHKEPKRWAEQVSRMERTQVASLVSKLIDEGKSKWRPPSESQSCD